MTPEAGSESAPLAAGDDVEQLARFLAHRIDGQGESRADPFTVAELRRELIPYPLCRDVLEFAAKAEYDLAFLRLLDDSSLISTRDEELAEAVEEELGSPEPGLAFLGDFAASLVELEERMRQLEGGLPEGAAEPGAGSGPDAAPSARREAAGERAESSGEPARSPAGRDVARDRGEGGDGGGVSAPGVPTVCPDCGSEPPDRDDVRYCPYCGQDLVSPACGACGEELEPGWSFCPACGEAAR